jgi:hypothetical protein
MGTYVRLIPWVELMNREMGNEGAVLSGLKEAPEKFSDTIRMSLHPPYCVKEIEGELMDSWDVECY